MTGWRKKVKKNIFLDYLINYQIKKGSNDNVLTLGT
jgi:hypothetical protein